MAAALTILSLGPPLAIADDVRPGIDNRDAIESAVAPGFGAEAAVTDHFDILLGDQLTYDDNLYRLPTGTNVADRVGSGASREDHINAETAELDVQRTYGRQVFIFDAQAANNRFVRNSDLDNVSSRDKLIWAWEVGDLFSGQLGATYNRTLASFVNTTVYTRNVYSTEGLFGTGRYQLGPHWAIFGGVFNDSTSLGAVASKINDNDNKAVDVGTEYAFDPNDSVGFEYRYTDTSFSHTTDAAFTDYREDIARALFKYAFSERTLLDASAGYLRRAYATPENRDFSGDIWRVTLKWLPTEKTKLVADTWRNLQAYETAESAYFASTGGRLAPSWAPTEKIQISIDASWETEKYIGSGTPTLVLFTARHDTVTAEHASVAYTPLPLLTLTATAGFEKRNTNYAQFAYPDRLIVLNATFKF
jgi:hypothetical protein